MIRINLLPPEIIERRKYERYYPYVFIAVVILVGVVIATWGVLQVVVSSKTNELQRLQESAAQLRTDADNLAVFELKEQEMAKREEIAAGALSGRVEMGRLAEEFSLVLPDEVWVSTIDVGETTGMTADLYTPNPLGTSSTDGYKSAASTLVRLASLDVLTDVWLNAAAAAQYDSFQGIVTEDSAVQVLTFNLSAKLKGTPSAEVDQ